jgi:hypothetical protein
VGYANKPQITGGMKFKADGCGMIGVRGIGTAWCLLNGHPEKMNEGLIGVYEPK